MEAVGRFDPLRFSLPPEAGHGQVERHIRAHDDGRERWQSVLFAESGQQRFRVAFLAPGCLGNLGNGRAGFGGGR